MVHDSGIRNNILQLDTCKWLNLGLLPISGLVKTIVLVYYLLGTHVFHKIAKEYQIYFEHHAQQKNYIRCMWIQDNLHTLSQSKKAMTSKLG